MCWGFGGLLAQSWGFWTDGLSGVLQGSSGISVIGVNLKVSGVKCSG